MTRLPKLTNHIEQFNREYRRITGKESEADTWVWANIFGNLLSQYSELYYAASWDEHVLHDKVKWAMEHELTFDLAPAAVSWFRSFALLHEKVGCMVKPAMHDGLFMPDELRG